LSIAAPCGVVCHNAPLTFSIRLITWTSQLDL